MNTGEINAPQNTEPQFHDGGNEAIASGPSVQNSPPIPRPITNNHHQEANNLNSPCRAMGPLPIGRPMAGQSSTLDIPPPTTRTHLTPRINEEMVLNDFVTPCTNCRHNNQAVAKCFDCDTYLCDRCVHHHSRSRATMGHTLYHWCSLSGISSSFRCPPRRGGYTPNYNQPRRYSQYNNRQYDRNVSTSENEPANAQSDTTMRESAGAQQQDLHPRSRAVGAERRSIGEQSSSGCSSSDNIHSLPDTQEAANSQERTFTLHDMLTNLRVSSACDSEISAFHFHGQSLGPISPPTSQPLEPPRSEPDGAAACLDLTVEANENQETQEVKAEGPNPVDLALFQMPPCASHKQEFLFYCTNCLLPVCINCVQENHASHSVIFIREALEKSSEISKKLNEQIRMMNGKIRTAIDGMQHMCEVIDYRAHQVAIDVKCTTRKCISTLEQRQDYLLKTLNQNRIMKQRLINFQMENIRESLAKLAVASDNLNNPTKNLLDNLSANHQAYKVLCEANNLGENIAPLENEGMKFIPPGDEELHALSTIGDLRVSSAHMSNSVVLSKQPLAYLKIPVSQPINPLPGAKSRAIHGCKIGVAIKDHGRTPVMMFGKSGRNPGEFCRPWGITINRFGQIIVADRSNSRIQVLEPDGRFIFQFGSRGSGKGQFERPSSVAISPTDDMVVADKDNHRIQVFNRFGEFLLTFGEKGSQLGQFLYPWDVACDSEGNIAVADARNHRIQLFRWNGVFVTSFGGELSMPRHFDTPRGVTFDPNGNIMLTDFNMHRVVIINRVNGKVRFVGREGRAKGYFNRPQGIFCDDRGWFVVADSRNYRCQVFNQAGELMWTLGINGSKYPGEFDRPSQVCVDPRGHIYIMDFGNDRVQVY